MEGKNTTVRKIIQDAVDSGEIKTVADRSSLIRILRKERPALFHREFIDDPIKINTHEQVNDMRNRMAEGNYPVGMSTCEVVGISGGCGFTCPAFKDGDCKNACSFFEKGWEKEVTPEEKKWLEDEGLYEYEREKLKEQNQ